ncbi:hypothetical protein ACP8HI_00410 [Paenibacillus sp. FA6]|uniref:hypothetical protein n=1 Tax=Paenibacillus sp. FA6 TaxID=3413029 RepID=UPI003F65A392
MKLVFASNDDVVLQTDKEKWEHYELSKKNRKLSFYIKNAKRLKFDVSAEYLSDITKKKGGVYFFYNRKGFLRNIGQAHELHYRIYQKFYGKVGGSIADEHFYRFYYSFKAYYIECWIDRLLCELYFINTKKPFLNYQDAFYPDRVYKTLTKAFKEKGNKAVIELEYLFKIVSGDDDLSRC